MVVYKECHSLNHQTKMMSQEDCAKGCKALYPSWKVNTLTVFVKSPLSQLNITEIRDAMATSEDITYGKTVVLKKGAKKNFPNSVVLRVTYNKHTVVKLFSTGDMQITGAKSIVGAKIAATEIIRHIDSITSKDNNHLSTNPLKVNPSLHMINSSFKLDKHIRMEEFYNNLKTYNGNGVSMYSVVYEKNDHPGVNAKFVINDKHVTVLFFRTGSVIITGAQSFEAIFETLKQVDQVLKDSSQMLFDVEKKDKVEKKRGRKRKCDQEAFYDGLTLL